MDWSVKAPDPRRYSSSCTYILNPLPLLGRGILFIRAIWVQNCGGEMAVQFCKVWVIPKDRGVHRREHCCTPTAVISEDIGELLPSQSIPSPWMMEPRHIGIPCRLPYRPIAKPTRNHMIGSVPVGKARTSDTQKFHSIRSPKTSDNQVCSPLPPSHASSTCE